MMTMRLYGSTTLARLDAARHERRVLDLRRSARRRCVRTTWISTRLMPQVASSVSSGRPYSQRMTMRSSTMPTSAGDDERAGTRAQQVPVEQPGRMRSKQVLHDVGRIGADHDQLAVRHVDHAHQPVGDREAERGEQQDRAERDAGEQRRRHSPQTRRPPPHAGCAVASDFGPPRRRRAPPRRAAPGVGIARFAERADRGEARRLVLALDLRAGGGHLELRLDVGVRFRSLAFRMRGSMSHRRRRRGL